MTEKEMMRIVVAGHVDHGKSTLIGRLLYDTRSLPEDRLREIDEFANRFGTRAEFAFLLDHLEEERSQGMTMDMTEVFFETSQKIFRLIDAPGHAELIRNMMTGASQADAAILIVDAHAGIEEQTRRHGRILSLLGIEKVILAVNKMDLVDYSKARFDELKAELASFLSALDLCSEGFIPISALKGENVVNRSENLRWYDGGTLIETLDALDAGEMSRGEPLIFPVQDVYEDHGKEWVVGRVESGVLRRGERIKILPGGQAAEVAVIEKYPEVLEEAVQGENVGLRLQGRASALRGAVICRSGAEPDLTSAFKANLFWMAPQKSEKNQQFRLRCATQETFCKIGKISGKIDTASLLPFSPEAGSMNYLELGDVVIKTQNPIVCKPFREIRELGRFVLLNDGQVSACGMISGGA